MVEQKVRKHGPNGSTVLVIEDEPMLCDLLTEIFTEGGYRVLLARDGAEAVKTFGIHRGEISLILADIGLPKLNGRDAYEEIRNANPNVKVVFASGYLDPDLRTDLLARGASEFIQKPYDSERILTVVDNVMEAA